jgi:hypothetical protein
VTNLKLLGTGSAIPREQLMARMDISPAAFAHCCSMLGQDSGEEKLNVWARLSPPDLSHILQSPNPVDLLEEVHGWWKRGRAGSLQPHQLLPAGVRVFEDALPQRLRSLLPTNWRRITLFAALAQEMEAAAAGTGGWSARDKAAFDDARTKGQLASADAEAAQKDEQAVQETKQQARQQQKRQPPPPPQQQQRELERRPSGSGERPGSSGGGSSSWGPPSQPQPAAPAAAAAGQPGPAKVSFAAASQQQAQEQQQADAGISTPPALLSQHPDYQHMPPAAPYAGLPGQPAPAGQPWHPGMTPQQQQQQQQPDLLAAVRPPLPPQAFSGPLQGWMLWHYAGAERALHELVADDYTRERLFGYVRSALDWEVAMHLEKPVVGVLAELKSAARPFDEGLVHLAELLKQAKDHGPEPPAPVPSPAPQPAPMAALAPHLQRRLAQQQQQQQQPAGASTHMLPPHLQHHHAQQQQQQPLWQQQQADDDDDSDDEDGLMNLLTGSGPPAAAGPSQQQQQSAWGGAAAQQPHAGSGAGSDFPALGVERGSCAGNRPTLPGLAHAGLANETGEYNCFLNVVVQCLYSCREFRNQVWELPPYVAEHPVVVALKRLFTDMQQAESVWQPGGERWVQLLKRMYMYSSSVCCVA